MVLMTVDAQLLLQSRLPAHSLNRLALATALALTLFITTTNDADSRWTANLTTEYLTADDPRWAGWLPEAGGIFYETEMGFFYQTFFKNPNAPWRYAVGFEPAFLPEQDFATFQQILWNKGNPAAYAPWVKKMRPQDRLALRAGSNPAAYLPQLEWTNTVQSFWIGRLPRAAAGTRTTGRADRCATRRQIGRDRSSLASTASTVPGLSSAPSTWAAACSALRSPARLIRRTWACAISASAAAVSITGASVTPSPRTASTCVMSGSSSAPVKTGPASHAPGHRAGQSRQQRPVGIYLDPLGCDVQPHPPSQAVESQLQAPPCSGQPRIDAQHPGPDLQAGEAGQDRLPDSAEVSQVQARRGHSAQVRDVQRKRGAQHR